MNDKKAKKLRELVYGKGMSKGNPGQYATENGGRVCVGKRREYQEMKKAMRRI